MVTTTNLDKMNKMRRTAREMTEAQRDSNRAPTENLVAVRQRSVRSAQEWMHNGANALREQTEHNLRTAESIVEGRGLSPSPSTCYPRIRSLSSPLRGEAWKG